MPPVHQALAAHLSRSSIFSKCLFCRRNFSANCRRRCLTSRKPPCRNVGSGCRIGFSVRRFTGAAIAPSLPLAFRGRRCGFLVGDCLGRRPSGASSSVTLSRSTRAAATLPGPLSACASSPSLHHGASRSVDLRGIFGLTAPAPRGKSNILPW